MSSREQDVAGGAILTAGWRQGSLLPSGLAVEHIAWFHHARQGLARPGRRQVEAMVRDEEPPTGPFTLARPGKAGDRLVVLSHTCDIVKEPDNFPMVEVGLVLSTASESVIAEARQVGSARFYALGDNPDAEGELLVLDYRWRTQIDKGFLVELAPDNTVPDGWEKEGSERFGRWLARRYGRPVLSDEDVAEVLEPIRRRWKLLMADEAALAAEINKAFIELRFRRIDGGVEVFALSPDDQPDAKLALEAFGILEEALAPFHGKVRVRTDKIGYDAFTRKDDLATEAIDLDWASDDESGDPRPPL